MWLNKEIIENSKVIAYQQSIKDSCPNHIVIDGLFNDSLLNTVLTQLQNTHEWKTQLHTYSALYVDKKQWETTPKNQRFVQRDIWCPDEKSCNAKNVHSETVNIAQKFLSFLRGKEFMSLLSRIFNVTLTDINVANTNINTNFFRLGSSDFVEQHADDSPGREVCMLLYLNQNWNNGYGGELCFHGQDNRETIYIPPTFNRCVLFNPSSVGSEHWVRKLNSEATNQYRYNVTSWYWSE